MQLQDALRVVDLDSPVAIPPELLIKVLNLPRAHVDCVVDFEEDCLSLLLVLLLKLEVGDQLVAIFMLSIEIERHIVDRFGSLMAQLDTVLS